MGESDTLHMGGNVYWSYLHASTHSAGIHDSCGGEVQYPGCVTLWVSTDGGQHFTLDRPQCLFPCNSCPCDNDDQTWQQQYPRVIRAPDRSFLMVYEHGAAAWLTWSMDGIVWAQPWQVPGTGMWFGWDRGCDDTRLVGAHPFWTPDQDCMAGGPPGLFISEGRLYVFVGLGQNPGHMGCFWSDLNDLKTFTACQSNPILSGAAEYGPIDAQGMDANPYYDFRFVTSADVVFDNGYYYMTYEGIRGPNSHAVGRDNQFALAFARSQEIDAPWEKFAGNPVLSNVVDNWGIGHADLLIVDGLTYMYTGTPWLTRGRYLLVFK